MIESITKAVVDYLHYFHGIDLDERQQRKLREEWIAPTIIDAEMKP